MTIIIAYADQCRECKYFDGTAENDKCLECNRNPLLFDNYEKETEQ